MSDLKAQLVQAVVREHFGDLCERVASHLSRHGRQSLAQLRDGAGLDAAAARRCVATLLDHGVARAVAAGAAVAYELDADAALRRLQLPALAARAGEALGRHAEIVVDVLCARGSASVNDVIEAAPAWLARYGHAFDARDRENIKRAVRALATSRYIVRSRGAADKPAADTAASPAPQAAAAPESSPAPADSNAAFALADMPPPHPAAAAAPAEKPRASSKRGRNDSDSEEERAPKPKRGRGRGGSSSSASTPKKRGRKSAKDAAEDASGDDESHSRASKRSRHADEGGDLMGELALIAGYDVAAVRAAEERPEREDADERMRDDDEGPKAPAPFQGTLDLSGLEAQRQREAAAAAEGQPAAAVSGSATDEMSALWTINYAQFVHEDREKACLALVAEKISPVACEIVKIMLRLTREGAESVEFKALLDECHRSTNAELSKIDPGKLQNFLGVMCRDKVEFISQRRSEHTTSLYALNIDNMTAKLKQRAVESVVNEKFGRGGLRVFRMLISKKFLDLKQISDYAMMLAKPVRLLVYTMMQEGYVRVQEVPKSAMREPKDIIYLWTVDYPEALNRVTDEVHRALLNLRLRYAAEYARVQGLVAKVEEERGVEAYGHGMRDVEALSSLTEEEKAAFSKFLVYQDRLDVATLKLCSMLNTLSLF
eukprot:m51a1_g2035 DNA-directed RNA polymerase, putative (661) ;mRNA; r:1336444-1338897